jgi:hypothetical protein
VANSHELIGLAVKALRPVNYIALQHRFPLAKREYQTLMSVHTCAVKAQNRVTGHAGKEATMELRMRLNVLAAIMSFAFLAAIVFGMI